MLARLLAVGLNLVHDGLPGAFGQKRVLSRQAGFEDELIVGRIGRSLPFEFEDAQGGLAVGSFQ